LSSSIPSSSSCCKPPSPRWGIPYFCWYILFHFVIIICYVQNLSPLQILYGPLVFTEARYYVLINKAPLARVKTLNRFLLRRTIFFSI
jgi:hypothetical protein